MACASYPLTAFESLHMVIAFKHPGLFLSEHACPALGVLWISSSGILHPACLPWPPALTRSSLPVLSTHRLFPSVLLFQNLTSISPCPQSIPALSLPWLGGPPACSCPAVTCSQYDKYDYQKGLLSRDFIRQPAIFYPSVGERFSVQELNRKKKMWTVQGNALNPLQFCQNLTSLGR